jgi:GNAT superfamily N-acetyltransferase
MNITYTNAITVEDYNMLIDAVGWGTRDPDKVRMALDRTDYLVVAQADNRTIGMARVMQDGLQALVMDVAVLPAYQKQGIGKEMMKRVMAYLDSISRDGGVFVNLMSALGRESFYQQFGFERRPNEHRGPGMTQWIEVKGDV